MHSLAKKPPKITPYNLKNQNNPFSTSKQALLRFKTTCFEVENNLF
jgi:hypothetical protein